MGSPINTLKHSFHFLCEDGIEKSVPCYYDLSSFVMPKDDHWDRFFYLALVIDSYIITYQ